MTGAGAGACRQRQGCRYVRSFETNGWFKFNDSLVTAVVEDDLFAKVGLARLSPSRTQCGQGCARQHRANAADGCGRRIAVPLQDAVPVVVPLLRAVCRLPGSVRWKMRVCQEEEEEAPASSSWTSMSSWWGRKRSNTFAPRLKDSVWRSAYMLMCAAPRRPIVSVRIRLYDVRDCAQHARTGGTPEHCRHCTAGTARSTRRTAGLSRMT